MADNIKVHFVTDAKSAGRTCALYGANVHYTLFSILDHIKGKTSGEDMTAPNLVINRAGMRHTIIDSGLFTFMFGAGKGQGDHTFESMREWMHRIVRFAHDNDVPNASWVECDVQRILGPEAAWKLRTEMRELMGGREVINVFHLPDGEEGFRKLVEFSDYIAISVPELRLYQSKTYKKTAHYMAVLARRLKPSIKIHLLGCTEYQMLSDNAFCTSADSSSWTYGTRYGFITHACRNSARHTSGNVNRYQPKSLIEACADIDAVSARLGIALTESARVDAAKRMLEARLCRADYELYAGNQD